MKHMLFLAAAAVLGFVVPAAAKPGNGHASGHGFRHGYEHERPDFALHDPVGYGIGGCPPGLAKKHNGCKPPGQDKEQTEESELPSPLGIKVRHRR